MHSHTDYVEREPRWPAIMALVAIGALHLALPSRLSLGPDWLLIAIIGGLLAPAILLHRRGLHSHNQWFGSAILAIITADILASLALLVSGLPAHREAPQELLRGAVGLWLSNVLVFASWYWRLDGGGPHKRSHGEGHTRGAFLFPQMTLHPEMGHRHWKPGFVDYLFLAFNTSTAFSPTDVPVLSRWAKLMMMLQALISLSTLAILAARAVNIL